ncbi:hypothetical protein AB3Y40_19845 [Yoonia sp. R2331]|uniref:hypothetical protein n=1 Tax=Yoonia sp. R2331 TaxID=3237238 RepID=UPI0034E56929
MEKELLHLRLVDAIMMAKRSGFDGLEQALYQVAATLNEDTLWSDRPNLVDQDKSFKPVR